jgi:hypothetical protein
MSLSVDELIPMLKDAIWKRLGAGKFLRQTDLLLKLGHDLGVHPEDVRRGFIRLKEQGFLGNVAQTGHPLGNVKVHVARPSLAEPESSMAWSAALQHAGLTEESRRMLQPLHAATAGLAPEMLAQLASGLERMKQELNAPSADPLFVLSAKYLLGSSKIIGKLPAAPLRQYCPALQDQPDRIPYVVTAGPARPQRVILIENPWAFERAIEAGLAGTHALVATFGYGLSRNGEAFGKQLQSLLTGNWAVLIQLRRNPEVADLEALLTHPSIEFWGDLDLEALRIYRSLLKKIPKLELSSLYVPLQRRLIAGVGHPYHLITGKAGQQALGAEEFFDLPDTRRLALLCATMGLDQECLSLEEIAEQALGLGVSPLNLAEKEVEAS